MVRTLTHRLLTAAAALVFATATWSGNLPVGRFVEFGFIGVNPEQETTLKWDVVQTYADKPA